MQFFNSEMPKDTVMTVQDRAYTSPNIIRYRYSDVTNIGAAPNIQYNWETDELSLPVGIGFDTLI